MKDKDLKEFLFADIIQNFVHYFKTPLINENTEYFTVKCPLCNKNTAFVYKNNPTRIQCSRLNQCQYQENYFEEFIKQYKREHNKDLSIQKEDFLHSYLKTRGVEKILQNPNINISLGSRRTTLIYDFQGYKITHYTHSSSLKYKKPAGKQPFLYIPHTDSSKELYLVEGIYDMFSLLCDGKHVACSFGSVGTFFLESVKTLFLNKTYSKMVLCFDNDSAGTSYTVKTINFFKDMNIDYKYINWKAIESLPHAPDIKDINDLYCSYTKKELDELNIFVSSLDSLKQEAIGEFYQITAQESYNLYSKTPRLFFKHFGVTLYNGLNVVGARTSNFKTSFLLNLFNETIKKEAIVQFNDDMISNQTIGLKSIFITLEEDIGNTIKKLDYINHQKIYTQDDEHLKEQSYTKIYEKLTHKETPIIALEYNDWDKIYNLITTLIRLGYNIFFIDYLQLIQNNVFDARYQALGEVTSKLNMLGNKYGVYFLLGSQLTEKNIQTNQSFPTLEMLRESSNIANDAKNIYLLEYKNDENVVFICNPKNRYAKRSVFKDYKDIKKAMHHNSYYTVDKFKIMNYVEHYESREFL